MLVQGKGARGADLIMLTAPCGLTRSRFAAETPNIKHVCVRLESSFFRGSLVAVSAAPDQHTGQQQQEWDDNPQSSSFDHGLESFKRLLEDRRFHCTQCGKCCTGDGEVWITDEEAERIAAFMSIPLQRFCQKYTRAYSKAQGFRLLQAKNNETRDCVFLQPDNTCSIHTVRPLQCSTYPWWPDLMNDADWEWEKANICEGFDHPDAPPTDVDDAARQLRAATALEYRRMLSVKPSKKQQKAAAAAAAAALQAQAAHTAGTGVQLAVGMTVEAASSSSSSSRSSPAKQQGQQLHSIKHASARQPAAGAEVVPHQQQQHPWQPSSRKVAAAALWQQRLAQLKHLVQQPEARDR